ncbi:21346_t:CDS:2, partial [Racocetra persica]
SYKKLIILKINFFNNHKKNESPKKKVKCAIFEAKESNIHKKNERKELSYINSLKKKRKEKRISETFVSQDPTKIFEMYSQPVNRYFNEASISSLEPELLPMLIEDVNSCTFYL